jgi:hypothetical protein
MHRTLVKILIDIKQPGFTRIINPGKGSVLVTEDTVFVIGGINILCGN